VRSSDRDGEQGGLGAKAWVNTMPFRAMHRIQHNLRPSERSACFEPLSDSDVQQALSASSCDFYPASSRIARTSVRAGLKGEKVRAKHVRMAPKPIWQAIRESNRTSGLGVPGKPGPAVVRIHAQSLCSGFTVAMQKSGHVNRRSQPDYSSQKRTFIDSQQLN
jgi:hypothetical protein